MGWISDIVDGVTDGILMGLVGAAIGALGIVVGAVEAIDKIIITIEGIITREKLKRAMKERGVGDVIINNVDKCENIVSFKALDTGVQYEAKGGSISDEIKVGIHI